MDSKEQAGRKWYCASCRDWKPAIEVMGDLLCCCGYVVASYADPEVVEPPPAGPAVEALDLQALDKAVLTILQDNGATGPGRLESLTPSLRLRIRRYSERIAATLKGENHHG